MTRRLVISIVFALVAHARADDPARTSEGETIVIEGAAPDHAARDRDRALTDAPFVTIVHPDEHPATASVADALGQTAGVLTRSLGGLGAYESVSVRGAEPGQTLVMIDGVPLARLAQVTTDLGRFALDSFGQVELYRGAVPVELGGAGVGGALNLVTRLGPDDRGDTVRASIGGGSFGARHVRVHYGDAHLGGRLLSSTTIGYQGATGDYTYYSDNGTPLNLGDDRYVVRANNAFDQVDASSRVGTSDGAVVGGVRAAWKHQGLPGSEELPALGASLSTLDLVGDAHVQHAVGAASARELGYVLVETQTLDDPMGELGLGAQQRGYLTLSGGASSTWSLPVHGDRATAGVELRGDSFRDRDLGGASPTTTGDRAGGAVLASYDAVLDPTVTITPAMRLDLVRTAPTPMDAGPTAGMPVPTRDDVVPSPRLTMRLAASPDVALKASGGWYVRLPTLVELFGDRGFVVGSPTLRPERGPSGDCGIVWAPARVLAGGAIDRVLVEAAGFVTRSDNTIAFITTAGYVARAANIGQSETAGAELVASARAWRMLSLTASYTELHTAQVSDDPDLDGKPLPRSPEHVLYARADVVHGRAGGWIDVAAQSESTLDPAELGRVPGRALVGAGARVEVAARVGLSLSVANALDLRVVQLPLVPPPSPTFTSTPTALTDVGGYPLPGRSFYLSMDWSH
ncbi:MAG TPA: TonB-dependent receptor [Kofleriaceae bacterium]|nr:TonB-dependent receptor [Kofleriaceae bacterium]